MRGTTGDGGSSSAWTRPAAARCKWHLLPREHSGSFAVLRRDRSNLRHRARGEQMATGNLIRPAREPRGGGVGILGGGWEVNTVGDIGGAGRSGRPHQGRRAGSGSSFSFQSFFVFFSDL